MGSKRFLMDDIDVDRVKEEEDPTPPRTPEPKSKKPKTTPSPAKSTASGSSEGKSPKALLAGMIIEAGIKALSKAEVHETTGFTTAQQKELLRKGRGSLRNALMGTTASL